MSRSLLTLEEKKLLSKAARLMEELIETIEVAEDKELVGDIEAALKEIKEGKRIQQVNPRFDARNF